MIDTGKQDTQPPSVATDSSELMGRIMSAFDFSDVLSVDEIRDIAANEVREYLTEQPRYGLAEIARLVDQGTDPGDRHPFIETALEMLRALSRPHDATVERVARAIYHTSAAELDEAPSWSAAGEETQRVYRDMARAALAALRDPGAGS